MSLPSQTTLTGSMVRTCPRCGHGLEMIHHPFMAEKKVEYGFCRRCVEGFYFRRAEHFAFAGVQDFWRREEHFE